MFRYLPNFGGLRTISFMWGFKETTFESCNPPELSELPPFDETQKAHLDVFDDISGFKRGQ